MSHELDALLAAVDAADDDDDRRLSALIALGRQLRITRPVELLSSADRALAVARNIGDDARIAESLELVGSGLYIDRRFREALERFDEARSLHESRGDRVGAARASGGAAACMSSLGDFDGARGPLEAALLNLDESVDPWSVALVTGHLGLVWRMNGELERAVTAFERARTICAEHGDRSEECYWIGCIGFVYEAMGRLRDALAQFGAAAEAARVAGDLHRVALWVINGGTLHTRLGEYARASECIDEGLSIARAIGDGRRIMQCLGGRGLLFDRTGDYPQAIDSYERALEMSRALGDRMAESKWQGNIGAAYLAMGENTRALDRFTTALAIARELGERHIAATWTGNLSVIHRRLGDHQRALALNRQALDDLTTIGERLSTSPILVNIALSLGDMNQFDDSLEALREAEAIATASGEREQSAQIAGNIAKVLEMLGRFDEAEESNRTALEISSSLNDQRGLAIWKGQLGTLLTRPELGTRSDPVEGERMVLEAAALAESIGEKSLLAHLDFWLSEHFGRQGQWERSRHHLARHHELSRELESNELQRRLQQAEHLERIEELEKARRQEIAEARAAELQASLLGAQLERKHQQLASTTVDLARQTEVLGRLRRDLRGIMRGTSDLAGIVREIQRKLADMPEDAVDWGAFEAEFEEAYPDFRARLGQQFPSLSKTESRICTLLRLKLATVDIAAMLGLSQRTIEWHRVRIRQKLGVPTRGDLLEALSAV
jgi:tetratricopeptide (TPR) repeat protein